MSVTVIRCLAENAGSTLTLFDVFCLLDAIANVVLVLQAGFAGESLVQPGAKVIVSEGVFST